MTPREYAPIWQDTIETSTYSVCKCGKRKRTVKRHVYNINGLVVTSPERSCPVCDGARDGEG